MPTTVIPSYDLNLGDTLNIPFKSILLNKGEESYDTSTPHRHNYYEIFYFENGGGVHDLDFNHFPIEDHSIHFVSPGQVHRIRRKLGSSGFAFIFSLDFYCLNLQNKDILYDLPFLNNNHPRPILHFSPEQRPEFLALINQIRNEYDSSITHKEEMIRSYLNILLLKAKRLFELQGNGGETHETTDTALIKDLRRLIDIHFHAVHAVSDYADMLSITPGHLNDVTKKYLGKTASDILHDRILLETKRLLVHSELSVKEIAYALGFDDPSYFSRFFRTHAGVSPSDFRDANS